MLRTVRDLTLALVLSALVLPPAHGQTVGPTDAPVVFADPLLNTGPTDEGWFALAPDSNNGNNDGGLISKPCARCQQPLTCPLRSVTRSWRARGASLTMRQSMSSAASRFRCLRQCSSAASPTSRSFGSGSLIRPRVLSH